MVKHGNKHKMQMHTTKRNNNKNKIVRISRANKKQQKQRETRQKKIINQNKTKN